MEKKQTAVQWLIDQYEKKGYIGLQNELQAKEMEKKQIIKARQDIYTTGNLSAEQYYNETYKSE